MAGRGVPKEGMQQQRESVTPLERQEESEGRICCNRFDGEVLLPKVLECLHTFYLQCLRQMHLRWGVKEGSIPCPLCRHLTLLPDGSLQNLPVNSKAAKGYPGSPAASCQTLAPQCYLQGLSRLYLPPGVTAGEPEFPAVQVEPEELSCAGECCWLLAFIVGVGMTALALYLSQLGFHKKVLGFVIYVSIICFLSCCYSCCPNHEPQQTGERGRQDISSGQRTSHHFGG